MTTTMTPAEVDGRIYDLMYQAAPHEAVLMAEKSTDEQREAAALALGPLRDEISSLHALWLADQWTRWYWVQASNGHLHLGTGCSTCYPTTAYAWVTAVSGLDAAAVVERYGWHVCTVCVPDAPTLPGFRSAGTAVQEQADADGICLNKQPSNVRTGYSSWGDCEACGARGVSVTRGYALRKHQHARAKADRERATRLADPKLACTPTGEVLKVDGDTLRTVRAAEIAAVEHLVWAHGNNAEYREQKRQHARTIAEALAAKAGTTADEVMAQLEKKAEKKRRAWGWA